MEREYSVAEARNQLAALIHAVESGDPVRITRRGRPVAVLLSENQYERLAGRQRGFREAFEAFRASVRPEDLEGAIESLEGTRDLADFEDFQGLEVDNWFADS